MDNLPCAGDNLGKLSIIPHRSQRLERCVAESSGGTGWVCGVSGSRGVMDPLAFNVRVVGAIAETDSETRIRPLRVQRGENFTLQATVMRGTPVTAQCVAFS